ncbi:MAG: nucleotidyltransferase substrate binding protein [Spirochaetales bacterium]|nr:nucleotidyltransferase substrate binding protein [Spirochaetales bacterium]
MEEFEKDIRWKQRFQNFEKAYNLLKDTVEIEHPSDAERAGLIKFFEMTFELSWKLLKDYQEIEGFIIKSPRDALKQAFQSGIVKDGHSWIEALENRNLTVHTYEEETAKEVELKIRKKYFPVIKELYLLFKEKSSVE